MIGKIFAAPFRLLNAPLKALDKSMSLDGEKTEDNLLDHLADEIEDAIDGKDNR